MQEKMDYAVSSAAITNSVIEPLFHASIPDMYREGLHCYLSNQWSEEEWGEFRIRFGIYGQKQSGMHMVRINIPAGVLPQNWLPRLAEFNRRFCRGDVHITTRQNIQAYFVPLRQTAEALDFLYSHGIAAVDGCGDTFRNVTACALAGNCPYALVDAAAVANRLVAPRLRQPSGQHMPHKVKIAVSGCNADCAAASAHDLGFIATFRGGKKGFSVFAGGGLGRRPRPAVRIFDFVGEEDVPTVVNTMTCIHQMYADPNDRNASRIKCVAMRFGAEAFCQLFIAEFLRLRGLQMDSCEALEWREPEVGSVERMPFGVVKQPNGRFAVLASPSHGNLSERQLDELASIGQTAGIRQMRTTREQNLVLPDVAGELLDEVVRRIQDLNILVPPSSAETSYVVSCPGTTTCRIGITNSQALAHVVLQDVRDDPTAAGITVRISGCHNSCSQHYLGDFGLHGLARKIDGQPAPHYQLHIGGDGGAGVQTDKISIAGPILPARHIPKALRLLREGYAQGKLPGESVRAWAERLGVEAIDALLAPVAGVSDDKMFIDWGEGALFTGTPAVRGARGVRPAKT